jgi:hypothetical protein
MPTINQLSPVSQVSGGDQIPIYVPNNGDARRMSVSQLTEYVQSIYTTLDQPRTGDFYEEQGADIQRLRDRVFMGAAADNNGTNTGNQPDWLTQYLLSNGRDFGFQQVTQVAVLADGTTGNEGSNAFLGAARTSTFTNMGNAIGILGVGLNNNAALNTGAWGGYFEGFQQPGMTGPCYAAEFDTINFGSTGYITPYSQASNQVIGLQIANGAEFPGANAAHAAINFRNNGARYNTGIVFGSDSLTGTDGDGTGTALAMVLARGHGFKWMSSSSINTTEILSTAATTANSMVMAFGEGSTLFNNASSGKALFGLFNVGASAVNYLAMQASAAGNATQMLAAGDDTNIDIQIVPKGTGVMRVGTFTSNADAPVTGYITIKDATGNIRKLATIA